MMNYIIPILISGMITNVYAIKLFRKSNNFRSAILRTTLLNFFLLFSASIWWFFSAADGFSQVFGIALYGVSFILIGVIYFTILFFMKRSKSKIISNNTSN